MLSQPIDKWATQIQAAVAYFQSHPASLAADAIWRQPDEQGRTMLHWAAYGIRNHEDFQNIFSLSLALTMLMCAPQQSCSGHECIALGCC